MKSYEVVFSHDIFDAQSLGGISRYYCEIRREVLCTEQGPVPVFFTDVIKTRPSKRGSFFDFFAIVLREFKLSRYLKARRDILLHRTYYPLFDLSPLIVPVVHTIHDMWDEDAPGFSVRSKVRSFLKYKSARRADALVCVSQFTLDRLTFLWPELAQKAVLIPHGVTQLPQVDKGDVTAPYGLFVGKRGGYKNFAVALRALSDVPDIALICVGGGRPTDNEVAEIRELGLSKRVHFVSADDTQLSKLYAGAEFFVYPSTYEGFGLPILESFSSGCPVILSDIPVFREVAGSAAAFADADDWRGWARIMRKVMDDRGFRASLVSAGYQRLGKFQWSSSAAQHVAAYDELMNTKLNAGARQAASES